MTTYRVPAVGFVGVLSMVLAGAQLGAQSHEWDQLELEAPHGMNRTFETRADVGNTFAYQCMLWDNGAAASGSYDLRFILYDAEAGGSQVGAFVFVDDLAVIEGRVTAQLDFGDVFDGRSLWLEVSVRDGASSGSYTVLSPRQQLTAVPYARHASTAESAATAAMAGDTGTLDGHDGAYYRAWANLSGVPAGLDDGDDDTLAELSCDPGQIARWNGAGWGCTSDSDSPYTRTLVVGPVGTATENGTALRNAIGAITSPSSQADAVLLSLEPGVYDLDDTGVQIPDWVTIAGAGESSTLVTAACCGVSPNKATLYVGSDVGLRNLAVRNTCAGASVFSVAVYAAGDRVRIEGTLLEATGAAFENYGVIINGSNLRMINATVKAENATSVNTGVASLGDSADIFGVNIDVGAGGASSRGIDNVASNLSVRASTIVISGAGVPECQGIRNQIGGDDLYLADLKIDTICSGDGVGVRLDSTTAVLESLRITGDIGIHVDASLTDSKIISMQDLNLFSQDTGVICDSLRQTRPPSSYARVPSRG